MPVPILGEIWRNCTDFLKIRQKCKKDLTKCKEYYTLGNDRTKREIKMGFR